MRTLFFGAGPLGSVYAHLLHETGEDVTVLARGERHDWIKENGLVLLNELTGQKDSSRVNVLNEVKPEDEYELVIVLIRKNKLLPVFEILAASPGVKNVLFMGNNALGFDEYVKRLPVEKVLFGFPGAGGGIREQVVHYADRERQKGKRRAVIIGEIDGRIRERTLVVKSLFESAGVPVDLTTEIDGWLKYHVALVSPLVGALYKYDPPRPLRHFGNRARPASAAPISQRSSVRPESSLTSAVAHLGRTRPEFGGVQFLA